MKPLAFAEFRSQVERLAQSGAVSQARSMLRARVASGPPLFEYRTLADALARLAPPGVPFRLAILSSFTLEPIREVLRATGLSHGFDLDLYFGGYQQFEQELLSPASGLAAFAPKAIALAWRLEELSPPLAASALELSEVQLEAEIAALVGRVCGLVDAAAVNVPGATCLLHTFVKPTAGGLGILDAEHPRGLRRVVDRLNSGLVDICRSAPHAHLVDCGALAESVGERAWRDARHAYASKAPLGPAALARLAEEYIKYLRAVAGKTKKVLVLDLDNTLWGGILGEDGPDGIALGASYPGSAFVDFQREIKQLSQRGVVLAINSKNNEADVRAVFESHESMALRWTDFAATRVNWLDKAANMRELAQELSLGLDSFVFVDDNPVEVERIEQELPEATVVLVPREPAELPGLLSRLGYFDSLVFSEEDRKRGAFYQAQAQRAELARSAGDNLEAFYTSLAMRLTMLEVGDAEIPRASQLTHRTNQFNMTTRRYTEADIRRFVDSPGHLVRAFRLADRFGDNGLISLAILERVDESYRIDTWLMSCRVIGRTVEDAILALLADEAKSRGAAALVGEFRPTPKNAPAREVYGKLGFDKVSESESGSLWRLDLATAPAVPPWIETLAPAGNT